MRGPGLAIQIANGNGLLPRLQAIEALAAAGQLSPEPGQRAAYAKATSLRAAECGLAAGL